jgi:hypothetical protein
MRLVALVVLLVTVLTLALVSCTTGSGQVSHETSVHLLLELVSLFCARAPGILHTKFMLADGQDLYVGSAYVALPCTTQMPAANRL